MQLTGIVVTKSTDEKKRLLSPPFHNVDKLVFAIGEQLIKS